MNYRRLFIPNSIVFITVVTFERQEFLIQNIELLRYAIKQTKQKYKFDIVRMIIIRLLLGFTQPTYYSLFSN